MLFLSWPTVDTKHPDHYALEVLGDILAGSRIARLRKTLQYDQQTASRVNAFQVSPATPITL